MKRTVCETTKVNTPNLRRDLQYTAGFIGQWFQKPPLSIKSTSPSNMIN